PLQPSMPRRAMPNRRRADHALNRLSPPVEIRRSAATYGQAEVGRCWGRTDEWISLTPKARQGRDAMMKDRPLIGINTDYCAAAKGRNPHSYTHSGYYDCILSAGGLPV